MADVRPFPGIRYNNATFGRELSSVVCPPYDVISPAEQAELYAKNAANFVRLELTQDSPNDPPGERYVRAGRQYREWMADSTLVRERVPAVYAYQHNFTLDGVPGQRRGLVAALRLEPWERRVVR